MEPIRAAGQNQVVGSLCLLGRQPIYDANRKIQAYELLYRRKGEEGAGFIANGDEATAQVLLAAFLEIGLSTVSSDLPVFVNHTAGLLATEPIMPPEQCVIEVLEGVEVNAQTIASLEHLKGLGYRIALDDFVYSEAMQPFLKLADYVKLDLRALSSAEFRSHVDLLHRIPVKIVAEKVESAEEFESSRDMGCGLFQGYYLRKPEVLHGRRIPANRLSALSLLLECARSDQSAVAIADVLSRDPILLYGVLRLANSALHGRSARIESPVQAVSMLGMDTVVRWASLLVLAGFDDCPIGYLEFALQRARACEIVAEAYGLPNKPAYIMGLLSTLDSILNAPLADIIQPLRLNLDFTRALLQREGELGTLLGAVLRHEADSFETASPDGFSIQHLQAAFWEAVAYSHSMITDLKILKPGSAR